MVRIRLLKRALRIYERKYGENSPEVAHILLGHLVLASLPGRFAEVTGNINRAIEIFETNYKIQSLETFASRAVPGCEAFEQRYCRDPAQTPRRN